MKKMLGHGKCKLTKGLVNVNFVSLCIFSWSDADFV